MGWFALAAMAVGTVMQAQSQKEQGQQQQAAANAQADQIDIQAAQERDAAVAQAEKIRRAGRRQAAEAEAAYASSGVSVGTGTPVRINESIYRDSEEDAFNTILTGERRGRSLDTEAALTRRAGANARSAGNSAATGSLLSGAAQYGTWKYKGTTK
ncbi:hypothetical protein [Achromobacter sp.]|uniref:virion core protein, T7 gp14 family n=1 Tax=Achromobacter sp. TaxID=134375 RepID=UPI000EBC2E5E|nr:hypothetical protein [Achromobacter sp.]HCW18832.1 hypothetical protein [Achromobacter sp.]